VGKSYLLQQLLAVTPQSPQLTVEQDTNVHQLFLLVFCQLQGCLQEWIKVLLSGRY